MLRRTPALVGLVGLTIGTTVLVVATPVLTLPAAAARPVSPVVRTLPLPSSPVTLTTSTSAADADATARQRRARPLQHPQRRAKPLQTPQRGTDRFSMLAVTWARPAAPAEYSIEARTRTGGRWTPWAQLPQDEEAPNPGSGEPDTGRDTTAPMWVGPSDGVQVRITPHSGGVPAGLSAVLVDPGRSPADAAVDRMPAATAAAHIPQPPIYRRAAWGADESLRNGAPRYTEPIKAAFVHHSAGTNSYSRADVPAIIRGIYAFHVKSRGWSDIGYNFLVDKYGRIWEGRHGGIARAVLGAHTGGFNTNTFGVAALGNFQATAPTDSMVQRIAHVIAWKFSRYGASYGLDARGKVTLTSAGGATSRYRAGQKVTFYRVSGHRDPNRTACPGEYLYSKLPRIRALAWDRMRRESTHRGAQVATHTAAASAPTYTFRGHGYGHGRGMSQWGAARAATLHKTARQITDFYYAGSKLGRVPDRTMRVLLTATDGDRTAGVRRQAGLKATVYVPGRRTQLGSRSLTDHAAWRVRTDSTGLRLEWSDGDRWTPVRIAGTSSFARGAKMVLSAPAPMRLYDEDGGSRLYRGAYHVIRRDAARLRVVNHVALESQYLPSVVPSESLASWPAAALQAQAIAARSFSVWYDAHPRASDHDLCDSVSCQVYLGVAAETSRTTQAVRATRGLARIVRGAAIRAEFSSSNGGSVATGGPGHSAARYDPWSDGTWDPNHDWTRRLTAAWIASKVFGAGATLTSVVVTKRNGYGDWGGRVVSVTFTGRRGRATVRVTKTGEQARFLLGLRSSYFTVTPPR